ncbi:hypothetical protein AX14_000591 [Amanita brunnescens Koide BX004]|nr:hypothetical protein AX14_000591 [Amanita brunnescens Koide BX004]
MSAYVRGYWHSAFNLPQLLHHFIPHESVPAFRTLLQTTGGIISGSVALQYLDRRTFQPADLDIYIVQDKWTEVIEWLLCHGLVSVNAEDSELEGSEEVDVAEGYTGWSDIESVVDFNNKQTARTVQVISTKRNPVYAVLQFHSSCVMNFLTHDMAISLYPISTFCGRRSIVWGDLSRQECNTAEKYEGRGWRVCHFLGMDDVFNHPAELGTRRRHIGDRMCWTMPLDIDSNRKDSGICCSWSIDYSRFTIEVENGSMSQAQEAFRGEIIIHD